MAHHERHHAQGARRVLWRLRALSRATGIGTRQYLRAAAAQGRARDGRPRRQPGARRRGNGWQREQSDCPPRPAGGGQVDARPQARGEPRRAVRRARSRSGKGSRRPTRRSVRHVRAGRVPPLRAARARARACPARAGRHRHGRQPRQRSGNVPVAPRSLPLHLAQGFPFRAHVARHRAGRHAPVQGPLGRARGDREAAAGSRKALRPRRRDGSHFRQDGEALPRTPQESAGMISYETDPSSYNHWKLGFDGPLATLTLDVAEDKGLVPGYKLKLNSYDLGVDIELHDALNRIRFEHPEVKAVILTSGKSRMFCSGANIYMLGHSSHAWKVNFCKFTNETRNGIEDASEHSGVKFIAALNGTTAGGGYELALACDEIAMIDDRSSTVSLPEVPLLGVLPGTGGLTRIIDKRKVRRDLADVFCTTAEGVRADRAKEWKLIDHVAKPQQFMDAVKARALELAKRSDRPGGEGVKLTALGANKFVDVQIDRETRTATLTVKGPGDITLEQTADWYPLRLARELDRAILDLRTNQLDVGLWILKTQGDPQAVLKMDALLEKNKSSWFVRETLGLLRRTFSRLDVSSRSIFAVIEPGSCFAGTLLELALAADRSYMLDVE